DPTVLVGRFDRPNLVYRIVPRQTLKSQVERVVRRHEGEAVIVYCITRNETEKLAEHLSARGIEALAYHAGLSAGERRRRQDAFTREETNVIVATVAFGMGIDRSDVRAVIHAGMPQSIEHYQQETGRAGRDGLEAECVLFHSPADSLRWQGLLDKSVESPEWRKAAQTLLDHMRRFCAPGRCRHRVLSEYFQQPYPKANCGACDVCLGESEGLEDGTVPAQMVLSCVARVGQRFGMGHVVDVLRGAETDRIRSLGHDRLSTYGLMSDTPKKALTHIVFQLIEQDLLARTGDQYPTLQLTEDSLPVLRGEKPVLLAPTKAKRQKAVRTTRQEAESWDGVDRSLFDRLRALRRSVAVERGVPPYVVFNDASLRDMARVKPATPEQFLRVHGVGEKKLSDYGERFLAEIAK
ncbi:MAG: RecQ family ATP-dependent DNA helicase, partial [Bacteroidota bacterium]